MRRSGASEGVRGWVGWTVTCSWVGVREYVSKKRMKIMKFIFLKLKNANNNRKKAPDQVGAILAVTHAAARQNAGAVGAGI